MKRYLDETPLLDFSNEALQQLIQQRQWLALDSISRVRAVYNFVRDEIPFGYNRSDHLRASEVLRDGYGQCNTKTVLLMALLRAVGMPSRIHGFTIDKALQRGAIRGLWYRLSPRNILHSWAEVHVNDQWYILEGVILDLPYLQQLQKAHPERKGSFCGYGVFTDRMASPPVDWNLNHTFIQDKGINQDFGVFDAPDDFFRLHQQQLSGLQALTFRLLVRHLMNRNVARIRNASG